jgi:hypothetical protein
MKDLSIFVLLLLLFVIWLPFVLLLSAALIVLIVSLVVSVFIQNSEKDTLAFRRGRNFPPLNLNYIHYSTKK